jgi:hypothetical protein
MLHRSHCQFHDLILRFIASHKFSILHLKDAVHVLAHAQVMCDNDPGAVVFVDEIRERLHDLIGAFGVKGGGRLVCQNDGRIMDQGTRDGDALLLAAGELRREVVQPVTEPETGEDLRRTEASRFIGFAVEAQHEFDVFSGSEKGDQVVRLEGEANLFAAQPDAMLIVHPRQVLPIDQHLSAARGKQRREDGQHRGLARSARSDQRDELPGFHLKGNMVYGVDGCSIQGKCFDKVFDFESNVRHDIPILA